MRRSVILMAAWIVFPAFGCGDNSTGATVFVAEGLTIVGKPSILGETGDAGDFITIEGLVESNMGIGLTGLKVRVRALDASRTEMGAREVLCSPSDINAGGSCTFRLGVSLGDVSFLDSREIEITPLCDQGQGTARTIPVQWPSS